MECGTVGPCYLLGVVITCALCLDLCRADSLGAGGWRVVRGSRCSGSAITVTCDGDQRLVVRSTVYNISCLSTSGLCSDCQRGVANDTNNTAPLCDYKTSCVIPTLNCQQCHLITGRLEYTCIEAARFHPMCGELTVIRDVSWGLLYSELFPALIASAGCRLTLPVPGGWRAIVRPIYTYLIHPARIDVCSTFKERFMCVPPGETEHLGEVIIHVIDAEMIRFLLEFRVYNPSLQETTDPGIIDTTLQPGSITLRSGNSTVQSAVSPHTLIPSDNDSSQSSTTSRNNRSIVITEGKDSGTNGINGISHVNRQAPSQGGGTLLTNQDYVIIGLGVFLGIVIIFAVLVFVAVYRRSSDSSQMRRVVVVLVREPTKRLSQLSRLFRTSVLCGNGGDEPHGNPRYSNPPEELTQQNLSARPIVVDESVQTVLAINRLQQLSNLTDSLSSDSERYEHVTADILRKTSPQRRQRPLRTSELVIELPAGGDGEHQSEYSQPLRVHTQRRGDLTKEPTPVASSSKVSTHQTSTEESIYEPVDRPVLPPRGRDLNLQGAPLESGPYDDSLQINPPGTSQGSPDYIMGDDVTIVENDTYGNLH